MSIDLSVIVCTYDRPGFLADAIGSLRRQSLDPSRFEIVVVDNVDSPAVRRVVEQARASAPQHTIRLVVETRTGLGYARNRGLNAAQGRYVGFIDDDALADPRWAQLALARMEAVYRPACVGGVILPRYDQFPPPWFRDAWETWSFGEYPRTMERGESLCGSNMVWSKSLLQQIGGFATDVGVSGGRLSVGEETAAFDRLGALAKPPAVEYRPELIVRHRVAPYKFTVRYRLKRYVIRGVVLARAARRRGRLHAAAMVAVSLAAIPVHLLIAVVNLRKHHSVHRWLVEEWEGAAARTGMVLGSLGITPRFAQG